MKKLVLLFLVLTGMVSTVNADNIKVYLETTSTIWGIGPARYVAYYWTGSGNGWAFFSLAPNESTVYSVEIPEEATGMKIYRRNSTDDDTTSQTHEGYWNTTGDITSPTDGELITITDWDNSYSTGTYTLATISTVTLGYGPSGEAWGTLDFEGSDGTYTATLDLSNTLADQGFKLIINGNWLGTNSFALNDENSLVTPGASDGSDLTLNNSNKSFKTYTLTATWAASSNATANWTLTITGGTKRAHQTINVGFTNNMGWENLYAYTYDPVLQSGAWPGTAMEKKSYQLTIGTDPKEYDYYSYEFEAYEPYPTKIIFNDGGSGDGHQTGNLDLFSGQAYTGPIYVVVGNDAAFGSWSAAASTAQLCDDGDGTYSLAQSNIILNKDFEYKVAKKAYYGYNGGALDWYPGSNQTLGTPVKGKYNVEFYFNPSTGSVDGSTATKTYEAVTIGATGWATTVTNSPLNFADLKGSFKAYTATLSGTTVTLNEVDDVQAETGLVLKGNEGTFYVPVIASSETAKGDLKHSSTYEWNVVDATAWCFGLTVDGEGNAKFAKVNNGETIPAQKAFLTTAPGGAHEFTVDFGNGGATGINNLNAERNMMNGEMYNLAGQKVNKGFKGIVIMNGKKVMMK